MTAKRFVDLFCGIGGFHYALKDLGYQCVFACDSDKNCRDVYEQNHNFKPVEDIRKVKSDTVPDHEILCAGFPCQAFSKAGHRKGFLDTVRGTLFFEIVRILSEKMPQHFILENVTNILSHDEGNTYKTIRETMDGLGYFCGHITLCPRQLKIPQNRNRVFIYGVRKDVHPLPELLPPKPRETDIDRILVSDHTIERGMLALLQIPAPVQEVLDAWEELIQHVAGSGNTLPTFPLWTEYWTRDINEEQGLKGWKKNIIKKNAEFYKAHEPFLDQWLETTRQCSRFKGSLSKLEWQAGNLHGSESLWNSLFQFRPSGIRVKKPTYSPALVAMTQVAYIGKRRRMLSLVEVARLQGFPSLYRPHPKLNVALKQFGNAVNVEAARWVAANLLEPD